MGEGGILHSNDCTGCDCNTPGMDMVKKRDIEWCEFLIQRSGIPVDLETTEPFYTFHIGKVEFNDMIRRNLGL